MPELPRKLAHIYKQGTGKPESYTSNAGGDTPSPPIRERAAHAEMLLCSLNSALAEARAGIRAEHAHGVQGPDGFVLEFRLPPGQEKFVEKLEDRRKGIELLSVFDRGAEGLRASVYIPGKAEKYFQRKIVAYRDELTPVRETNKGMSGGRPKNEPLVNRIDAIALAGFWSVFADDRSILPPANSPVWWEVWLHPERGVAFSSKAEELGVWVSNERLRFTERDVVLAFSEQEKIGRCVVESDGAVAEVRLAKDAPSAILGLGNYEQVEWANELANRIIPPGPNAVAVCILDSGVTRFHPLILPALDASDVHKYDPNWPDGDSAAWKGHGTAMAGLSLYGDLFPLLLGSNSVELFHRLESVKMLPHDGKQHEPRLYGAITRECATRPEVTQPHRPRVHCMAVTSPAGTNRGRPSSWSAAIDQLAYGDERVRRLIVLSAGNVHGGSINRQDYPDRNVVEPIENPAQSWNALTVGAYTEKNAIADPSFDGWKAIAPKGGLAPSSRTSVAWEHRWPIKPEVVLEGGNWADFGADVDSPDDLAVLTTYFEPVKKHFEAFRETSAAASLCAHLSARVMAHRRNAWPETVRALIVHSAEWTPLMWAQMDKARTQAEREALLRRFGYGVPNLDRAVLSSSNDVTIVAEERLRPFRKDGTVKTKDMNLHRLPWPREELSSIGATDVQLRVTLSYFIEPNPGERGWYGRYRYPSHSLRFVLKRRGESDAVFRARINRAVVLEEEDRIPPSETGDDGWFLGRIRDKGSLHSDIWIGSAAELLKRDALAVYPIGGWWKEKPHLGRFDTDVRYSLCLSLRALSAEDIYTPIAISLEIPIASEIG